MCRQLIKLLVASLAFARCSFAANIVEDACTGDANTFVYFNDACYTHELSVMVADDHMAQSCQPMNGLRGHLALPISSEVMQSWSVFTSAHPSAANFVGAKKMSDVSTLEDGWYFMYGTKKLHAQPLDATLNGDPPMLLPWASPVGAQAQPNSLGTSSCGQVPGDSVHTTPQPLLYDNACGSPAGYAICEYGAAHNRRSAVRMVAVAARDGTPFKPAAVTQSHGNVPHWLVCLERCAAAGSACRCVAYSAATKDCTMSVFPCDRDDIFDSADGGDFKVFKRKLD